MENWKIKKNIILSIMELAKAAYPNEFSGMLVGDKDDKIIDDIYIIPATTNNLFSSSIRTDLVPMSLSIVGSVHSHPSNYARPSNADLHFFSSKSINIIAHYPYAPENYVAFNSKGEQILVQII